MNRRENRAVIVWREAASAELVSPADRVYMKATFLVLHRTMGTKCPIRIATLTKRQTDFLLKTEMGGKPF